MQRKPLIEVAMTKDFKMIIQSHIHFRIKKGSKKTIINPKGALILGFVKKVHTYQSDTLGQINIQTIAVFRCKMAFFNWAWHKVIVLPRP